MTKLRMFLTVITIVSFSNQCISSVRTAVSSGNWEKASTWKDGKIPSCGDSVVIGAGNTVHITSNLDFNSCKSPLKLNVTGKLIFESGAMLSLPCNSSIDLNYGSKLICAKSPYNLNKITVCEAVLWNSGMGNLDGPLTMELNTYPKEIMHISARPEGENVVLSWVTTAEMNNDYFMIEKSRNGVNFKELGKMNAAGTSTNINSYTMVDIIPYEGIQFYKLTLVDFDGSIATSNSVAVKWEKGVDCVIYPNPTKGELFANLDPEFEGQTGQLLVNNADGKLLLSKAVTLENSGFGVKLLQSKEFLKPGKYLVTLNFKEKSFTQYVVSK